MDRQYSNISPAKIVETADIDIGICTVAEAIRRLRSSRAREFLREKVR